MGREQRAEFYDDLFANGGANGSYHKHYSACNYFEVWEEVLRVLRRIAPGSVLELGCGPGQFARMVYDALGPMRYLGVDFSETAIEMARRNCPEYSFEILNIVTDPLPGGAFDCAVCLEALEHIHEDLRVLEKIPSGMRIVFSVPNFDSASHVRWFRDAAEIARRYEPLVEFREVVPVTIKGSEAVIFVIDGERA